MKTTESRRALAENVQMEQQKFGSLARPHRTPELRKPEQPADVVFVT